MSVSVSMPQLGESVTEGTVTRWLKREGERVEADEPLLEVSTDKVDTEIPSPVSGVLRGITVAEDETVAVGAELAVIDEEGAEGGEPAGGAAPAQTAPEPGAASANGAPADDRQEAAEAEPDTAQPAQVPAAQAQAPAQDQPAYNTSPYQQPYQPQPGYGTQAPSQAPPQPPAQQAPAPQAPAQQAPAQEPGQPGDGQQEPQAPAAVYETTAQPPGGPAAQPQAQAPAAGPEAGQAEADGAQQADGFGPQLGSGADGPYVTPLVRKLATEHGIDLGTVSGTGVGGRIRKQDVLDASRVRRDAQGASQVARVTSMPLRISSRFAVTAPFAIRPGPTNGTLRKCLPPPIGRSITPS